jgi:hypothetical protein
MGSGTIVGRNDISTAAHVVNLPGYKLTQIAIYPAYDGTTIRPDFSSDFKAPYGSFIATRGFTIDYYSVSGPQILPSDIKWDLALIGISNPIGDRTGWDQISPNQGSGNYKLVGLFGGE